MLHKFYAHTHTKMREREGSAEDRTIRTSSSSSSHSHSSLPFAHLSFFKALTSSSSKNSPNDLTQKNNERREQKMMNEQRQGNCFACKIVGTAVSAVGLSAVAYDRMYGPLRPGRHRMFYNFIGFGFACLGVLRVNDLTLDDVEKMVRNGLNR